MAEEEAKKVQPEASSEAPPAVAPAAVEPVETKKAPPPAEEKAAIAPPPAEEKAAIPPPTAEEKADDCKALVVAEKPAAIEEKKSGSIDRDAVLARVATEKRLSLIKAWEESEKSKAENKAQKKISAVAAWENSQKATLEAELKKIEEQLEKKKAEYIEKMKNKVALVHKAAEEKRAIIEAKRGEDLLKAEEMAAKYRATGTGPKKLLSCFSS